MKKLCSALLSACMLFSLAAPACALEVEDAKQLLEEHYIDALPENLDELNTLDQLFDAIDDPYTMYMDHDRYKQFMSSINGTKVVGIGVSIQVSWRDGGYAIIAVLPDSPALEAGLREGDIITEVDGVAMTPDTDPTAYIRGPKNSEITVTVSRPGDTVPHHYTMKRRKVKVPIVTYEMMDDAAYIKCDSYGDTTVSLIAEGLKALEADASTILMDLRSNPGGTSKAAAGSAGLFVGPGLMSYFRNGQGKYNYVYTNKDCPDLTDKPVIILTSGYSASGAEMYSAAIRDHGAGIALGQRTFGKGVAQYVFNENNFPDYFDGDAMKITVYRFFSPDGATNDTVGVLPTLMISPENTGKAALLLSSPRIHDADRYLKLELSGFSFYIDLEKAMLDENQAAFRELLEAIPPSGSLSLGVGGGWTSVTPAQAAQKLGVPFVSRSFADTADSPFARSIDTLASYHLLSGYEDGSFRPGETITRAEFCAMVARAMNFPRAPKYADFTDVSPDDWYADSVGAMARRGFISGYEDGSFRPNGAITYEEMVAVLANVSAWACMDGNDYAGMELAGQAPVTYGSFSPWARKAARNLDLIGALVGDLEPREDCTRQVAAGMLCALMEGTGLLWT